MSTETAAPPVPPPTTQDATKPSAPADNATVSGTVKPSKPPKLTPLQAALKAVEDATTAHETTGKDLATKQENLAKMLRQEKVDAGLKAIHAALLRVDDDNRRNTFAAFLDAAEGGEEKQAVLDYGATFEPLPTPK